MTMILTTTVESPIGPLTLTATEGYLMSLTMEGQHGLPATPSRWVRDDAWFAGVTLQLERYFSGDLREFDVPLRPNGTAFQRQVWAALRGIPFGMTMSYGELARGIGSPQASRAVGVANSRNPVAIIVPCHRVIGADGRLTGYAGGLERKAWLLEHERMVGTTGLAASTAPGAAAAASAAR